MKKLFLSLVCLCATLTVANAQTEYPNKGYRGFVGVGYNSGMGDYDMYDRISISTSHGYQISPYLFVGAGIAEQIYFLNYEDEDLDDETWTAMPIFGNVRCDFLQKKISPFLDVRVGGSPIGDINGMYVATTVGCRIKHINVGLGYEIQQTEVSDGWDSETVNLGAFSVKVAFDFGSRK